MEQQTNVNDQQQMSPEEFRKMQNEIQRELKEEIKMLKVEAEYERLRAEIEESKLRRMSAIVQMYRLQHGNITPQPEPSTEEFNHPEPQSEPFMKEETAEETEQPVETPAPRTLKKT